MISDISPTQLLENALRGRISVPARELHGVFERAGLNPRTLQRTASAHPHVIRLGRTRQVRYALTRQVRGVGDRRPLSLVHSDGRVARVGTLVALQNDHWTVLPNDRGALPRYALLGSEDGIFLGLPWYLASWRPDGFVGRNLARRYARLLDVPDDVTRWTDDDVVLANARDVIDPPGNWILDERLPAGDGELPVAPGERAQIYAERAERAARGLPMGSSAGGEQPKFTAVVERGEGPVHVLVKFSPPRGDRIGDRWADLLVCEHIAAEVLVDSGDIPAPRTDIVEAGGRVCLEVDRFDREGLAGRHGVASLMALSPPLGGPANNWTAAAAFLRDEHLLDEHAAARVALLDAFGDRIGNTDRHLGNMAVLIDDGPPFRLAPIYDMLPMSLRPTVHGELPPVQLPGGAAEPAVLELARRYWREVATHPMITQEFRDGAERIVNQLR